MADSTPQRAYRAPCPGCGAPVEFKSAQSTHAVCGYCRSTVVRDGEVLKRLGKMAELFDDHSLLQLGASGRIDGRGFTLVGRLQYTYREGRWTEWEALLDDGQSATLAEDNGAYVFSRPLVVPRELPAAERFRVGATTAINGQPYAVASNERVSLLAAQGELPHLPELGQSFQMVELRSQGEGTPRVLSIDYGPQGRGQPPSVTVGRPVTLDELQMTGLRAESAKDEKGRHFDCPSCGGAVEVALAQSKSIACPSCHSLIDLGAGVGAELRHAVQDEPVNPLIPLGSRGQLYGVHWQVVGFQHRMGQEPGEDDEWFGWEEYLLYNARQGFAFLIDAEDGWSLVKPTTGAPVLAAGDQSASYLGRRYALQYSYNAKTTYVAGEFYWQVSRGQQTFNRDFTAGANLLSMEQTPSEITWSSGSRVDSQLVAKAFGLEAKKDLLQRTDAAPLSSASALNKRSFLILLLILLAVLVLVKACSDCDPNVENCSSGSRYRGSGGSFGGFSTGGGHK